MVKKFAINENALPDRAAAIAQAMACDWGEEKGRSQLKARAALARKFATDIKQARGRLVGVLEIVIGEKPLEQPKSNHNFFGWKTFTAPIVSADEKALLLSACAVLDRLSADVERARGSVEKLHKQREAEHKERLRQARDALDVALFRGLDRRGEILFVAAMHPISKGWGAWADLLDAAAGQRKLDGSALETFKRAIEEEKIQLAERIVDAMNGTDKNASELAAGVAEKYRHPETEEKYGAIASQVTTFLVAEQLAHGV